MKKFFIAAALALISSAAYADGSPCEDVGKMISELEHQKKTSRITESQKGVLAAGYQTYYQSGCSENQLKAYFKNGETPKSSEQAR